MLTHLSIRDVVLIETLDLEFESGFTALTGETGAGKSIILDALGLALGARGDAALIRAGAERLSVAASFLLPADHGVLAALSEQGFTTEDRTVVLRRVIGRDGRSRAFINDQPAGIGLLKAFGARLVEIHGQFDAHGLLDASTHLDVLDAFRHRDQASSDRATAERFSEWQAAERALGDFRAGLASQHGEEDYLAAAVEDLDALAPAAGEEATLTARRGTLKSVDQIVSGLSEARQILEAKGDVEGQLRAARARVGRVTVNAGGKLDRVAAALERAVIETTEAMALLVQAIDDIVAEPGELERIDERLHALRSASRKHRCSPDELPAQHERLRQKLADVRGAEQRVIAMAAEAAAARARFERIARQLHAERVAAGEALDRAVAKELAPLKLDRAAFRTVVIEQDLAAWNAKGLTRVVLEAATNPGSPPGPLAKIASGGELARFMLALEVVLATTAPPCTMIFDEIDSGISGATANAVGERLARLGSRMQVLVVTHAPQVAARAKHHWRVTKSSRGTKTSLKLDELAGQHRIEEVARMLSGAAVTEEARAAAESLLGGPPS